MSIAQSILQQLGGNKFIAMTGSTLFVGGDDYLMFKTRKSLCINKTSKVKITLTPMDLYTVEFMSIYKDTVKIISKHEDVYVEDLQELFTRETGLVTRLF
jgi:hypothetical protein